MKVEKRDGRLKEFSPIRILEVVTKSYKDVFENTELSDEIEEVVNNIVKRIEDLNKDIINVEEIQDIVINELNKTNRKVGRAYKKYRLMREEMREKHSSKEKFYKEILQTTNVDNDNANIDQYSFSGRKYRIADNEQKTYAIRNLLSPRVRKAFEDGYIYIHDCSSYGIGEHNCLFVDIRKLLANGFKTRNCDVRPANSFSTACQLVAVIFQLQSQVQFGGVASLGLDFELEPYAKKSFIKHFKSGLYEKEYDLSEEQINKLDIDIDNSQLKILYPKAYDYALRHLDKEGKQATQALFHNLGTLESRAGSQVPFTSINYGRNTSSYGRCIDNWLLDASIDGVGKFHRTSIFPISIWQIKSGVNKNPEDPNYDLTQKAIKSLSMRIYPNFVNDDWTENEEDFNDYTTYMATMGCRTMLGKDIHTNSYSRLGRGNISPITINLPKIGIDYGICLGKRTNPDIEGFYKKLDEIMEITKDGLIDRYNYICNQSPKSAPFMYENGTMEDSDKCKKTVEQAMKHGTNALGLIGMAECCIALFGKHHGESLESYKFALDLIKHMSQYAKDCTNKYNMNFSLYFTPAENSCKTMRNTLYNEYGKIEGITTNKFLTNSIHIPVYYQCDAYSKLLMESPFTKYGTGGCITYIELDTNAIHNPKGLNKLINYAMDINIPYLAINFDLDTCDDCGYSSQINTDNCPVCGGTNIQRLKRVTGYLSSDYRKFNEGKIDEVEKRVKHTIYNPLTQPITDYAKKVLKENGINVPEM